jgi:hypothetical protein
MKKSRKPAARPEVAVLYRVLADIGDSIKKGHMVCWPPSKAERHVSAGELELVVYSDVPEPPPPQRGALCIANRELRLGRYEQPIQRGTAVWIPGDMLAAYVRAGDVSRVTLADLLDDREDRSH